MPVLGSSYAHHVLLFGVASLSPFFGVMFSLKNAGQNQYGIHAQLLETAT